MDTRTTIFPNYKEFFEIRKDLQKEDVINNRILLSVSNSLIGYIVYRANSVMGEYRADTLSVLNAHRLEPLTAQYCCYVKTSKRSMLHMTLLKHMICKCTSDPSKGCT